MLVIFVFALIQLTQCGGFHQDFCSVLGAEPFKLRLYTGHAGLTRNKKPEIFTSNPQLPTHKMCQKEVEEEKLFSETSLDSR